MIARLAGFRTRLGHLLSLLLDLWFGLLLGLLFALLPGRRLAQRLPVLILFKHGLAEVLDDRHAHMNLPRRDRLRSVPGAGRPPVSIALMAQPDTSSRLSFIILLSKP